MKKLIIILVLVFAIGGALYLPFANSQTITAKVNDKERITNFNDGASSAYYLIYTDMGVFKVVDQPMLFIFNSSDIYGKIQRDSTYRIELHGFRFPIFSMYPRVAAVYPSLYNKN